MYKDEAKDTGKTKKVELTVAGDIHSHLKSRLSGWCR